MHDNSNVLINSYTSYLNLIKEKVDGVLTNYVLIGHYLNQLNKDHLYKEGNYSSIYELAKHEFNLSDTTIKNSMGVASKYCDDDGSIKQEFMNYNFSALVELLPIENDKVITDFKPEMTVKEIREVKKSTKEEKPPITKTVTKDSQETASDGDDEDDHPFEDDEESTNIIKPSESTHTPLDLTYLTGLNTSIRYLLQIVLSHKKSTLYYSSPHGNQIDIYLDYMVDDASNPVFITIKYLDKYQINCMDKSMNEKLEILVNHLNSFIDLMTVLIDAN